MVASRPSLAVPTTGLPPESVVFGTTEAMRAVRYKVQKVAGVSVPVLIQGESGTGKEILTKLIHAWSPWRSGPLVKVSCPAIPATLLESELFGYEKGAFTGAYGTKAGRVELAHRGTLFLDEISELDLSLQAKLLQLLQDGQFSRIGAQEDTRVEVRAVCATNRRLENEVEAGSFRQDLFYRINVVRVELPPLRERAEDIPELVEYFLGCYNVEFNLQAHMPSPQLLRQLQNYRWPGNIRELENLIKRYVILGAEEVLGHELQEREFSQVRLGSAPLPADGPISLKKMTRQAVEEMEKKVILSALDKNNWNRKRAAEALKLSYRALLYKIRQAGIPPKRARARPAVGDQFQISAD